MKSKKQTRASDEDQTTRQIPRVKDHIVVPLAEEELQVDKQVVQAGAVRIRKEVEARTQEVPVELQYEEVQIERVPVNRVLGEGEEARPWQEGDTMVIPVVEEELVVLKRRVVREEIRVSKRVASRQERVREQVRSEQIHVEPEGDLAFLDNRDPRQG
jgi:uncharacterized protein (TIGR02271 family)